MTIFLDALRGIALRWGIVRDGDQERTKRFLAYAEAHSSDKDLNQVPRH